MGYYFTGLYLKCDGLGRKKCQAELTVENPDSLPGACLFDIVEAKGWRAPIGGGSTLCSNHVKEADAKYNTKLARSAEKIALAKPQGGGVAI